MNSQGVSDVVVPAVDFKYASLHKTLLLPTNCSLPDEVAPGRLSGK